MKVEFKLRDSGKLERAFRKLVATNEDSMEKLIRLSVKEIAREARARAPYDSSPDRQFNKKRKHYKRMFRWRADKTFGWAAPMRRRNKTSSLGHILEFGSVHSKAQPHLMPAFRRVRDLMQHRIMQRVQGAARVARFFS